ncbi:MAG: glycosyltransferase family 1 protein, partial [Anaerolineae bacterium]
MRIGIDARLVYYSKAGIGQYIIHLTKALAQLKTPGNSFYLLQSRKDKTKIIHNHNFARVSLWTPSHNRLEQLALRFETAPLGLDLLHSPDFIPPFKRNYKSVITVHDL